MASKRVALYLRVSTQEQSTEIQRLDLERYVEARGWSSGVVYEDKLSGCTTNRPELKRLLLDAKRRRFDVLVVWKLDRLFRSQKDLVVTLQEFQDLGIEFVSLKDNIDLTTASGRLLMQIIGAMAEFEASLIRERVRAGLKAAKAKGKKLGRPRNPLRNDEAIYSLRRQGKSLREIALNLGVSKGLVSKVLLNKLPNQKANAN